MTEYVDFAEYYDLDHAFSEDIAFYLDWAQQSGSPVLELACGTGRVLIPLARAGFEIHGLDISANMLAECRGAVRKFGLGDRVHLYHANMVDFVLHREDFKLAYVAFRSFMHLLTVADQDACVRQVYAHLVPGGHFILNLIAPSPERLSEPASPTFEVRRKFELPNGHQVIRKQRLVSHDRVAQVRHFDFRFEERDGSGKFVRDRVVPLFLRYSFREELEGLLRGVGFELVEIYRDYDGSRYDGTGEMLVVARRPRGE